MAAFSSAELAEVAGLNSDGMLGFEAQVAKGRKAEVLWPEHFRGKRVDDFQRGSRIARLWLALRRSTAQRRRRYRAADFRDKGATSELLPRGTDRHQEQLEALRLAARGDR